MQKWTSHIHMDNNDNTRVNHPLLKEIFTEDALFFDIETTGFSPATTQLYLIGCARRKNNKIIIEQYFAENRQDEETILFHFLKLLEQYQTIITFNGIGFDIPYIKAKCDTYHLNEHFEEKDYIDLFKIVSGLKFLLQLPNYKQKTIEGFLGINRKDTFDGGELINVYKEYVKNPNEYQMFFLKQHNYEDVLGMFDLLPVLAYHNFFKGGYALTGVESNIYLDYEGKSQKELIFTLKNDVPMPKRVSCRYEGYYLTGKDYDSKLTVRLYEGTLKFFFPNYKDYYYLPMEDTAIHKDVASFVEKDYRKKATASTCYTKKDSLFLPQYAPVMEPAFKKEYNDKFSYFELTDEFIESDLQLQHYVCHILAMMAKQK